MNDTIVVYLNSVIEQVAGQVIYLKNKVLYSTTGSTQYLLAILRVVSTYAGGFYMSKFYTSGQVARRLRISVSTLKRWLEDPLLSIAEQRNSNGWRLFSEAYLNSLNNFKKQIRKNGKRFKETVLIPVVQKNRRFESIVASFEGCV